MKLGPWNPRYLLSKSTTHETVYIILFEESLKSKPTAKGHENRSRVDGSRRYRINVLWIRNKPRVRVIFRITVKQICNARGKEAPQSTNSAETRGDGDIRKEGERVRQLPNVINVIKFREARKKKLVEPRMPVVEAPHHAQHPIHYQVPFTQALSPTTPPTDNILVQWRRKSRTHRYPALPLWPNQSALPHLKWVMPQLASAVLDSRSH